MSQKELDWANIGFAYHETDYRYVADYKDGAWGEGRLITDGTVHISECASVLQYAQTCFEGLKVYRTESGKVVAFRPQLNAERIYNTSLRLEIPPFPQERFIEALDMLVKADVDWLPPFGSGATMYIRPFVFGSGAVIGVKPATEYQFRMCAMPVGPYYKGGLTPIKVKVSDFDRAAPRGTGDIKAGLNYAMSLHANVLAHQEGFAENIYLDPATRTKLEEAGGANIILVDADGNLVVPKSPSILPSITRRSIVDVAKNYLGLKVDERPVALEELKDMKEMGLCGTAAVISPVGLVDDHGKEICLPGGMDAPGPVTQKLYETLTGIQAGTIEAPEGWIHEIDVD